VCAAGWWWWCCQGGCLLVVVVVLPGWLAGGQAPEMVAAGCSVVKTECAAATRFSAALPQIQEISEQLDQPHPAGEHAGGGRVCTAKPQGCCVQGSVSPSCLAAATAAARPLLSHFNTRTHARTGGGT
jgi:hypothetical protein